MGRQTTATKAGAPIKEAQEWNSIYWKAVQKQVRRLQMRIAKAVQENRWNKEVWRLIDLELFEQR